MINFDLIEKILSVEKMALNSLSETLGQQSGLTLQADNFTYLRWMKWFNKYELVPYIPNCKSSVKFEVQHVISCRKFCFVLIWQTEEVRNVRASRKNNRSSITTNILNCSNCRTYLWKKTEGNWLSCGW